METTQWPRRTPTAGRRICPRYRHIWGVCSRRNRRSATMPTTTPEDGTRIRKTSCSTSPRDDASWRRYLEILGSRSRYICGGREGKHRVCWTACSLQESGSWEGNGDRQTRSHGSWIDQQLPSALLLYMAWQHLRPRVQCEMKRRYCFCHATRLPMIHCRSLKGVPREPSRQALTSSTMLVLSRGIPVDHAARTSSIVGLISAHTRSDSQAFPFLLIVETSWAWSVCSHRCVLECYIRKMHR